MNAISKIFDRLRSAKSSADYQESASEIEAEISRAERDIADLIGRREEVILAPGGDIEAHEQQIAARRQHVETLKAAVTAAAKRKGEAQQAEEQARQVKELRAKHAAGLAALPKLKAACSDQKAAFKALVDAANRIDDTRELVRQGMIAATGLRDFGEKAADIDWPAEYEKQMGQGVLNAEIGKRPGTVDHMGQYHPGPKISVLDRMREVVG